MASTLTTAPLWAALFVSAILAAIIFCFCFIIHYFLSDPSDAKLSQSDRGFAQDLINMFFFWQDDRTGDYKLSKTKVITFIIFVIGFFACPVIPTTLFARFAYGAVFSVPAFLLGYAIHNLAKPKRTERKAVPQTPKVVVEEPVKTEEPVYERPKFPQYRKRIDELERDYLKKEKNARELIEKKFTPPQISYDKFMAVVDVSTRVFNDQLDSARTLIDLASEDSEEVESEIKSKIDVLQSIIDQMEDLIDELVINMSKSASDDEKVHELVEEMSDLIDSVKEYR